MNLFIRPASRQDLPHLMRFAKLREAGITSLPEDEKLLAKKLHTSEISFKKHDSPLEEAYYLFVLQYGKRVIGVSGISTAVGKNFPLFVYGLTAKLQKCAYLDLEYEMEILNFETMKALPTEIAALFLEQQYRKRHFGRLLSYCRFLFMAAFPRRFSKLILAQLRGVSDKRGCPFWDAVGSKFYNIPFEEADFLRVNHPQAIIELFPRSPIYPAMLPKRAQKAIRVPHKNTIPARLLLEKEGFGMSPYCDLFDAGPHLYAARDSIRAIQASKIGTLRIQPTEKLDDHLITNEALDFRATIAPLQVLGDEVIVNPQTAALLNLSRGDQVRYLAL